MSELGDVASQIVGQVSKLLKGLSDNDVTPKKRGFVWSTEPRVTCAACSCPRGDRLVVYAADQEAHGLLSSLGFDFLYTP